MNTKKSTGTESARLAVLELSLIYFIPLLALVLHYLATAFFKIPTIVLEYSVLFGSLLFSIPAFIVVLLFLVLPADGAVRYVRVAKPAKKYMLAAVSSIALAIYFVLCSITGYGFILPNLSGIVSTIVYVFLPFVLLLFIPVWFTIPIVKSPGLPRFFGVISPLILLAALTCGLLGFANFYSGAGVGFMLRCLGAVVCTVAGIFLMILAANHPEILDAE
ncbi:hypothetical protein [Methanorbis furvi]|uniref:Uncharacterized protein n=1 Tax=Methanorbis furvi TaxID=3028299 RepID=A0AAE4SA49_9EURY|nr:hypothetical protein [Methanocorpusculaceae archaeon Ag1]